ncbi:MAG TPA: hypothetical protein VNA29_08280, partial [Sphingomicrobium sp.]|nr:hypothetical protein [Sphingomicrobium sp.]
VSQQTNRNVPMLILELELESRRNPSLAAIFQQVISRHHKAICEILEVYYGIVGRQPTLPLPELASAVIAVAEAYALTSQTRPSQAIDLVGVVQVLLGANVTSQD